MSQYIPEKTVGGKVWEDGSFGLSFVKTFPVDIHCFNPDAAAQAENAQWLHQLSIEHSTDVVQEFLTELLAKPDPGSPLGSSNVLNSHIEGLERARRGLNGISSYGKKLVRNACLRLDREASGDLSFLTLTLPNISQVEAVTLSRNWAEIIRKFNQWLKRALVRSGCTGESVGVTEIQASRFATSGVFALHYHCCFVGRAKRNGCWALVPTDIREAWKAILLKYLSYTQEHYDWRSVENIQRVKKSVSAYLGKYISKGLGGDSNDSSSVTGSISDMYPSSWYSCSNSLRTRVLASRVTLSSKSANQLLDICSQGEWDEWFHWVRPICLFSEDGFLVAGWAGQLTFEAREVFLSKGESCV